MKLRRVVAVARKEAIQIRRDPRSLAMAFLIPMILLSLYGYALTLDVNNLATVVWDQDRSGPSRDFLARFEASHYFTILRPATSLRDIERALDSGEAQVGIVVPLHFARDLELGRSVAVQASVDGSNSNTATIALGYLEGIVSRYSNDIQVDAAGRRPPALESRLRVWYNADLRSRNYIVPGLIAVIMMVIAALLTSLTVAREWERGTMEPLIATPIRVSELVLGKLLPYFVIGLVDVGLCVHAGTLVFGVPFRGSLVLLFVLTLVFLLGAQGLGMLISTKTRSQLLASQLAVMVTFLPAFILSGFVFDIENLPGWLQAITYAVPARYFVTILKGIFLKGVGLGALALETTFLLLFALVVTLLTALGFRKSLE